MVYALLFAKLMQRLLNLDNITSILIFFYLFLRRYLASRVMRKCYFYLLLVELSPRTKFYHDFDAVLTALRYSELRVFMRSIKEKSMFYTNRFTLIK